MSAHGYNPYTHGCRCEICRRAKADYMRQSRAEARKNRPEGRTPVPGIKHGYSGAQNHACRCYVCSLAASQRDTRITGLPGKRLANEFRRQGEAS